MACAKLAEKEEEGQVAIITKLGMDMFGDHTLDNFQQLGFDTSCVFRFFTFSAHPGDLSYFFINSLNFNRTEKAPTGVAPIYVDDQGHNSIIIIPGNASCI